MNIIRKPISNTKLLRGILLITMAAIVLIVPACNDTNGSVSSIVDELDGSQWKLISIKDKELVSGSYISLYFMQGKFWGHLGLNTYDGNYLVETPGVLNIFEFSRTLIGGSDNIIQQEGNYLLSLRQSSNYKLAGSHLEFCDDTGKRSLVLEKLPEYPMNPADLIGTQWELVSLDGESVSPGLSGILKFESETKATGEAGSYLTELIYQAYGDSLHIQGSSGKNRMDIPLPRDLDRQASQYTACLAFAASYRLSQDRLQIFTVRGNTLVFKPLTKASSSRVKIPNHSPVIYERLDYIMRGEFNYLYIYEDGSVIYVEEKGLRLPTPGHPPVRIWKTGKLQPEELEGLLEYLQNSGLADLEEYYKFPGKPIESGPAGGFTRGDMGLTITVNYANLNKKVGALGYLTPDHGETYPDMPSPLNEIYGKLRTIALATEEVARENISP